jgi:glycerophosphoryl diester phosphodiesterase
LENTQLIRDLSLKEIKSLDCGIKKNPKFPYQQSTPGTQIPTLGELIAFIQKGSQPNYAKIRLNIELKRDERHPEWSFDPADFAQKVVQEVKKHDFEDRVYYSSFDPEILLEIRHEDPDAKVGFIYNEDSLALLSQIASKDEMEFLYETAFSLKASILSPDHKMLHEKEQVKAIQRKGFRVIPWTVNEPSRWKELIDMGVDGIITDYPEELILFLK